MTVCREAFDFDNFPAVQLAPDTLCAIIIARNELLRLPYFMKHLRSIGVGHIFVVDHASSDGTSAFLEAQEDVTYLPTSKAYKDFKQIWRNMVANAYCISHWVLFVDADEQFVYPGWPERSLLELLPYWESQQVDCVFAPLVDMYADAPLAKVSYVSGNPFLETAPFFDGKGYRLSRITKKEQSPFFLLEGGPRERLFPRPVKRVATTFDRWIEDRFLSPRRPLKVTMGYRRARKWLRSTWPDQAPLMGKTPLVRWGAQLTIASGAHRVSPPAKMASDWCTLMHFKYFQDFAEKVRVESARKQHFDGSHEYEIYTKNIQNILTKSPHYEHSKRFNYMEDLQEVGLTKCSKELSKHLKLLSMVS